MSDDLPDRRRHGYEELEQKLNKQADAIEQRFHKRYRGMLMAFSVIGLTSALGLFGFGFLLARQSIQQDRLETQQKQLARLSAANRDLVVDIQQQRKASIRAACQDTNRRNTKTSYRLNKAAEKAAQEAPDAALKARIRESVKTSLGLIDSLAPKQNCEAIVKKAVKPIDPVPVDPAEGP